METVKHFFVIVVLVAFTVMAQVNLTVMTYNIFGGKGADGVADDEDIPRLGRVISAQSPDLLGLQESYEDHATELGSIAGLDNVHHAAPGSMRNGEAVMSKYPLSNIKEITMTLGGDRMLLFSEAAIANGSGKIETVVFITTHFTYESEEGKLESARIVDSVFNANYDSQQPAILTGDLNSRPGSDPINYLDQSWEIEDFNFRIDWIMYRPADRWNVISVVEIDTGEALQASDHKPIVMKLSLGGTGISNYADHNSNLPIQFNLVNNSNFYNSPVIFKFKLAESSFVSLKIFDLFGRMVKTLYNGQSIAGNECMSTWDFTNENREMVNAGKYLCVLQAGSQKKSKQIVVIK